MSRWIRRLGDGWRTSLSLRLIAPVLIALIPLSLVAREQIDENRERALSQAETAITTAASALASSERLVVTDAGSIISGLAALPAVADGGQTCIETLQAVAGIDRRFANLGVIAADGSVTCSALAVPEGTNLRDRTYFLDAMRYNELAWGSYQVGRITGKPSINVGYPLRAADGRAIGVVYGAVSLAFLGEQLATVELPAGASAIVVDRSGTILVDTAHPEHVGDPAYRVSLSTLLRAPETALSGLHGGAMIASVRELTGGAVAVSMPRELVEAPAVAEAREVLVVGIAAALLGAALAVLLTWVGIARPITRIRSVVREIAGGDLSRRLSPASSAGTLNGLAWDIDEMASALAATEAELRRHAFQDVLTGLRNRQALLVEMGRHREGTLIYLRLDSLPDVAAMLGYQASDEVVLSVARRLVEVAEGEALIARVSDSSFALFCPSATTREQALARMRRVLDAVAGGLEVRGAQSRW